MSERLIKLLWKKCTEAVAVAAPELDFKFVDTSEKWDSFIKNINDRLDSLGLELKSTIDESNGTKLYIIVNTKDDEVAQLATDFSAVEIKFFKAVVEQIMLAPNYSFCISSISALREVSHLGPSMTKSQGEIVLASFVARGWLLRSKDGRYSLAPRTILELNMYFREEYPDEVIDCTICMEILTKGVGCATPNCHTYLHRHCYESYRRRQRLTCPTCQTQWANNSSGMLPLGEAAFKHGQEKSRRKRRNVDGDQEDGEDAGDETQYMSQTRSDSVTASQSQTQTQTRTQTRSQRARVYEKGRLTKRNGGAIEHDNSDSDDVPAPAESEESDEHDAMDIDNLTQERTRPSRISRRS